MDADARDALGLLAPEARRNVRAAIDAVREDPFEGSPLERELAGMWRVRVGTYRLVYRFDDRMLEVVWVGRRATVYEDLTERLRRIQEARPRRARARSGGL